MDGYKKLIVWQVADEVAHKIYDLTEKFPPGEKFGLTSQLQRAAVSIPVNIVEGSGRHNQKETRQFANVALGSLAETEYLLNFCYKRSFVSTSDYGEVVKRIDHLGRLLWGFHKSL